MSEWTWNHDGPGHEGVVLENKQLLWYSQGKTYVNTDAARKQSFDDYRKNGPAVSAPEHVINELKKIIG